MLLYKYYSVNLIVLFLLILQLQKCCCRDEGVLVHNPPAHGLNSKQSLTEHKHQKTVHEIFLECAVKERIIPGQEESVLQTVHSYAKLKGIDKAVFFGLSNDVFIGSKSLINKCAEDKDANIKIVAKHIVRTRCQISVEKGVTEFKINDDFILNLKKSEYGKCVRSHLVDHKSAHHFEHYVCKRKDCGEVKMVLVERYGKDNGIKNIFYSKMDYSFECLKKHECGIKHELKEVHPAAIIENGVKLKQNKLFQECAVKLDDSIETLVKHVELSETQMLFFSKGEHIYYSDNPDIKQNCEKDKAARMKIHFKSIIVELRGGEKKRIVCKDYEEFKSKKKVVAFVIKPFFASGNRHCSAMAANHYYQIFLCQKEVCGHEKLFLMRKLKPSNKKLMKMEEGEDVHVTHIFTVENHIKDKGSPEIREIIKRCRGTEHKIEGVIYKPPSIVKKQRKKSNKEKKQDEQLVEKEKPKKQDEQRVEHKDSSKGKEHDKSEHENGKRVAHDQRKGRSPNNKVGDENHESHLSENDKEGTQHSGQEDSDHSGLKEPHGGLKEKESGQTGEKQINNHNKLSNEKINDKSVKHDKSANKENHNPNSVSDLKESNGIDKEGEKKKEAINIPENLQGKVIGKALNNDLLKQLLIDKASQI